MDPREWADEMYERFVFRGADMPAIAAMDLGILTRQVHEMREDDPDVDDASDEAIAMAILTHARANCTPAVLVQERNGYYQHHGSATVEDWDAMQDLDTIARVERIESLTGWAPYTAAYRVETTFGDTCVYFVAEAN